MILFTNKHILWCHVNFMLFPILVEKVIDVLIDCIKFVNISLNLSSWQNCPKTTQQKIYFVKDELVIIC